MEVVLRTALYAPGVTAVLVLAKGIEGRPAQGGFVRAPQHILQQEDKYHVLANIICISVRCSFTMPIPWSVSTWNTGAFVGCSSSLFPVKMSDGIEPEGCEDILLKEKIPGGKKMYPMWRAVSCILFCMLVATAPAYAGGLYLYEVGSPDVGTAAAGYAAKAQDASTVFTNPAGMTRLEKPEVLLGAQPMYLNLKFSPDSNTSRAAATLPNGRTADDGDASSWLPAGGLYYAHPVNDRLSLGMALNGYFGLALDYEDDWVGRYYAREAKLQALAFQPAAAWKFTDWFSVGFGVSLLYGVLDQKVAVNNIEPGLSDGELKVDDTAWAVQGNLGLLFEPIKGTRFGITYLTEADLDFSDDVEFSGLGPGLETLLDNRGLLDADLDLDMKMPQAVMFSAYHEFTDHFALMGNLGWQDWSEFGKVDVSLDSIASPSLTTDLDYQDTWHAALGAQYGFLSAWQLSAGVAYDSAMLKEDDVTPALPLGETWRFALGTRYAWNEDVTVGAAYELAWTGDLNMDVNRGPLAGQVSGEYQNVALHVICLNLNWRF